MAASSHVAIALPSAESEIFLTEVRFVCWRSPTVCDSGDSGVKVAPVRTPEPMATLPSDEPPVVSSGKGRFGPWSWPRMSCYRGHAQETDDAQHAACRFWFRHDAAFAKLYGPKRIIMAHKGLPR